ncbi:MAG: ABC transporter ATP-binding protein [Euryarchaeota archaeon]|nr:ABC transporter ATP-binding protein [Euryarchaeota archaeon]
MLETVNLRKSYFMGKVEVPALRGVDIKVEEGEFVSLMGPSGSGKTTLLNMVGMLDVPTSGTVRITGIDTSLLSDVEKSEFRLEKLGFIFQFFNLFMELTAMENVILPMMLQGKGKEEYLRKGEELLKVVGLGERMSHYPSELSGGQQQRVTIARALANEPALLLADEPTANLDSQTSIEIVDLFGRINKKEGKTIFMVTHEEELGRRADRIIRLRDGLVVG